jgi:hypothetical protein
MERLLRVLVRYAPPSQVRRRTKTALSVFLLALAILAFDVRLAYAYIDPLIPGFLYQIGYLILYGILGVGLFFRQSIKRMFSRGTASERETDAHEGD